MISLAIASFSCSGVQAIQLSDGTVYFAQIPRLEDTKTTHNGAGAFGATYYFTISLPPDAGEPLQRVTFAQTEGVDRIGFILKRTHAYRNNRRRDTVSLRANTTDAQAGVTVRFAPPFNLVRQLPLASVQITIPIQVGYISLASLHFLPGKRLMGNLLALDACISTKTDFVIFGDGSSNLS